MNSNMYLSMFSSTVCDDKMVITSCSGCDYQTRKGCMHPDFKTDAFSKTPIAVCYTLTPICQDGREYELTKNQRFHVLAMLAEEAILHEASWVYSDRKDVHPSLKIEYSKGRKSFTVEIKP